MAERLADARPFGISPGGFDGLRLLRVYLEQHPSLDLLDAVVQWQLEASGPNETYQLVRDELRRNPTLIGLDKLLQVALYTAPPEMRSDLELVIEEVMQRKIEVEFVTEKPQLTEETAEPALPD